MSRRVLLIASLLLSFVVCGCGSGSKGTAEGMPCQAGETGCLGDIVLQCVNGVLVRSTDCRSSGMTCVAGSCVGMDSGIQVDAINETSGATDVLLAVDPYSADVATYDADDLMDEDVADIEDVIAVPPVCPGGSGCPCEIDSDCFSTECLAVTCGEGECKRTASACAGPIPPACVPGLPEQEKCDGKDNDCNGVTDDPGATGCTLYFLDIDQDGYGVSDNTMCLCSESVPYMARRGGDCDDENPLVNPGMIEICNGLDDNCDGVTDPEDTLGCQHFYLDVDQDGFGTDQDYKCLCAPIGFFSAIQIGDCDDANPKIHPGRLEDCLTGYDDNCDGKLDQLGALNCRNYYPDADGDVYGSGSGECWCERPYDSWVENGGDCDDNDPTRHPGARKCGADWDCDGRLIDVGEECDDGNGVACDGCEDCKITDFRMNATSIDYLHPNGVSVTALSNGGFIVCWPKARQDLTNYTVAIWCRFFDSGARPRGPDFEVFELAANRYADRPTIIEVADGGLLGIWQSNDEVSIAMKISPNGSPVGTPYEIPGVVTSIARAPDESLVVAWNAKPVDYPSSRSNIFIQRLDRFGVPIGDIVDCGAPGNTYDQLAWISATSSGFVVAWGRSWPRGEDLPDEIRAQRFDPNLKKIGAEVRVNQVDLQYLANAIKQPGVVPGTEGDFLVFWYNGGSMYGRRFSADGEPISPDLFLIEGILSPIIPLGSGDFLGIWLESSAFRTFHIERFSQMGLATGIPEQFPQCSIPTEYYDWYPFGVGAAVLVDGSVVFVRGVKWSGASNSKGEIYGFRFDPDG